MYWSVSEKGVLLRNPLVIGRIAQPTGAESARGREAATVGQSDRLTVHCPTDRLRRLMPPTFLP